MDIFRRRQALAAAQIEEEIPSDAPIGAINGKFTINANGDQVYFSKGNLQYIGSAATPYWQFAEHQWDYLGNNGQGSVDQNVDRDLFGWGTSGYNHGAVCYQPWSINQTYSDYYVYGQASYHLFDMTGQADWGYNSISNGGNTENLWRTLTKEEWDYVFNTRTTSSGIRYAKAIVNNVNGVILLPDDWSTAYYSLRNTDSTGAGFSSNTITASQWRKLERHGAVLLPMAGYRDGTSFTSVGSYSRYYSASKYDSKNSWSVYLGDLWVRTDWVNYRYFGLSVRLVQDIQDITE